jgi:hypothetical protein
MAVNTGCIVKGFQILKDQPVSMVIIMDFKTIEPFTFNNGVKRFDAGIIPWIGLFGVTSLHFCCCFLVFF